VAVTGVEAELLKAEPWDCAGMTDADKILQLTEDYTDEERARSKAQGKNLAPEVLRVNIDTLAALAAAGRLAEQDLASFKDQVIIPKNRG
jgi:hypothetical protein